ncbi:hypothetical protein Tco_0612806 [Tanacetum coccineum]
MESIRRNFFNGIRDGEKKIAWVSWSKVLASKSNGGLGVSSFYALNRGLLFKWIWRFLSRADQIVVGPGHSCFYTKGSNTSTLWPPILRLWSSIIKCNALKSQGLDLISHCKIRVGNGMSTSFWHDQWLGDSCLRLSYPRLFALENNKVCSVAAKMSAPFVSSLRWLRKIGGQQIPIKGIVLALEEILYDRLPTRVNLYRRGVQVFPYFRVLFDCEAIRRILFHLLFCCDLAKSYCLGYLLIGGAWLNPVRLDRSGYLGLNLVQLSINVQNKCL